MVNQGRHLFTDNWYTSIPLAKYLLQRSTHLTGTIRRNRKQNPEVVAKAKLPRGDTISRQLPGWGITMLQFKDKREVFMLSTKVPPTVEPPSNKPQCILEYNKAKLGVDKSDQLNAYHHHVRRTTTWQRRLVYETLMGTAVSNSWLVFNMVTNRKMSILKYRELLIEEMLGIKSFSDFRENYDLDVSDVFLTPAPPNRCRENIFSTPVEQVVDFGIPGTPDRPVRPSQFDPFDPVNFCCDCTGACNCLALALEAVEVVNQHDLENLENIPLMSSIQSTQHEIDRQPFSPNISNFPTFSEDENDNCGTNFYYNTLHYYSFSLLYRLAGYRSGRNSISIWKKKMKFSRVPSFDRVKLNNRKIIGTRHVRMYKDKAANGRRFRTDCQLCKRKRIRKTTNMFCAVCELSVCEACWEDHQFQEGPQQ